MADVPLKGSPPADPKDPLCTILSFFTDPKTFLKAPSAPEYTNMRAKIQPKKRNFLVTIFKKVPMNAFFCFFFQKFACGAENMVKMGS